VAMIPKARRLSFNDPQSDTCDNMAQQIWDITAIRPIYAKLIEKCTNPILFSVWNY
jgi:hypothetical protein